jgi:hypothetical protein
LPHPTKWGLAAAGFRGDNEQYRNQAGGFVPCVFSNMNHSFQTFLLACLLVPPLPAAAQITYVDATPENLARADGGDFAPVPDAQAFADGNWSWRSAPGLASHDTIYEAGGGEAVPVLKQTLSGLAPGLHDIYAFFWVAYSSAANPVRWRCAAGFAGDELVLRNGYNDPAFSPVVFGPPTVDHTTVAAADLDNDTFAAGTAPTQAVGGSDRTLVRFHLGKRWVDASGTLAVFVHNGPLAGNAANSRTWFDGLGHAPAAGRTVPDGQSWAVGLDNAGLVALSGLSPNGLFWGDGSSLDADNTAIHASIDGDAATPAADPVSLAEGESIRLAGTVDFRPAITDTPGPLQFRWGLFNHNGSPDAAGWTGYWAGNGSSGSPGALFRQNDTNPLYVGSDASHGAYLPATFNAAGAANIAAGAHRFELVLSRAGARLGFRARLTRTSDGAVLADLEGSDESADFHRTFTRIGFLSGAALDAGQLVLSGVEVVYPYIPPPPPPPPPPGEIVQVAPDGVWTWFNDERAIWHQGRLYAGYVRRDGRAGITRYDPASGQAAHAAIGSARSTQVDDHNNPSLTALPDGRLLAVYAKHGSASEFYHRTSLAAAPATLADWGPESIHPMPAGTTYANTFRLAAPAEAGTLYHFTRCINYNPCLTRSTDGGATWGATAHFINVGSGGTRPYPRYVSNRSDRIDLIYSDGHPRNENNSIYHLSYRDGMFSRSDGTPLKALAGLPIAHGAVSVPGDGEKGSVVYQFEPALGRGWTWDIHYGAGGLPVCVFQTQRDDVTGTGWNHDRIYYHYARWTGGAWQRTLIAQAGRGLYAAEDDYGGGICLDPDDPRVVYLSSNAANPFAVADLANVPLAPGERYEIWRGVTLDGGLSFTWTPVTSGSAENNIRPIVPEGHGRTRHLLWLRGSYSSYTNYNTRVMGIFDQPRLGLAAWQQAHGLGPDSGLDSDGDGLSDLLEYALGGDPRDPADAPAPRLENGSFTFTHLPARSDAEWVVETSTELTPPSWSELAVIRAAGLPHDIDPGLAFTTTGGDHATITLSPLPPGGSMKAFVRLRIRPLAPPPP